MSILWKSKIVFYIYIKKTHNEMTWYFSSRSYLHSFWKKIWFVVYSMDLSILRWHFVSVHLEQINIYFFTKIYRNNHMKIKSLKHNHVNRKTRFETIRFHASCINFAPNSSAYWQQIPKYCYTNEAFRIVPVLPWRILKTRI